MQPHFTRFRAIACAAILLLFTAPRASAETLTLEFVGVVPGASNVTFSYKSETIDGTPGPYYWNTTPPPNSGGNPVGMFCIELTEGVPGTMFDFDVVAPVDATTIPSQAVADAIAALYGTSYNPVWNKPDTAMTDPNFHAFQLALWELIYDGAGSAANRFTTGDFRSSDPYAAAAQTMISTALGDVAGGMSQFGTKYPDHELVALLNSGVQDQLYLKPKAQVRVVPAPSAALLAGIGILALLGRTRWNRRTPSPA